MAKIFLTYSNHAREQLGHSARGINASVTLA
jgi:hypothetical protein